MEGGQSSWSDYTDRRFALGKCKKSTSAPVAEVVTLLAHTKIGLTDSTG